MAKIKIDVQKKYFFKYILLDNFFSDNEMQYFINRFNIEDLPSDGHCSLYNIRIFKDNKIEIKIGSNLIPTEIIMQINKKYENILYTLLSVLAPTKHRLIDYIDYSLVATGKDYKYEIHDDIPAKLLSTVIYLKPEENLGTILHPCPQYVLGNRIAFPNENFVIKWKASRAMIFSRIGQKTWHSFQGDGKSNRLTFLINVGTNKMKEARLIEDSKEFKKSITWVN